MFLKLIWEDESNPLFEKLNSFNRLRSIPYDKDYNKPIPLLNIFEIHCVSCDKHECDITLNIRKEYIYNEDNKIKINRIFNLLLKMCETRAEELNGFAIEKKTRPEDVDAVEYHFSVKGYYNTINEGWKTIFEPMMYLTLTDGYFYTNEPEFVISFSKYPINSFYEKYPSFCSKSMRDIVNENK